MATSLELLTLAGLVGSGLIAGVFFAFSTFVMPALARLEARRGLEAMQTINVTVMHPSVMGVFFGTAALSVGAGVLAGLSLDEPGRVLLLVAAGLYVLGTFLVTGAGNVPLNEALAKLDPAATESEDPWRGYLSRWTVLNHVRTAAAAAATLAFCLSYAQQLGA